jgi:hypothetical protein
MIPVQLLPDHDEAGIEAGRHAGKEKMKRCGLLDLHNIYKLHITKIYLMEEDRMEYLQEISLQDSERWDSVVKSFIDYDAFYLSTFSKAYQHCENGTPLLLYYNDGKTRAINVVVKRDIAECKPFKDKLDSNKYFDLTSPYGFGGFWYEGYGYDAVHRAYDKYCEEQGYVCEFVRFHLLSDEHKHYSGVAETHSRNVVCGLEMSTDEIYKNFSRKLRQNLNKAFNVGLEVEFDFKGEKLDAFLELYYSTMKRTNANEYYWFPPEFFAEINNMKDHYVYVHVSFAGRIVSSELAIYGVENCHSFLGGTNQEYFQLCPNPFLKFEMIKWARSAGLKRLFLGGGCGCDDSLFEYKKKFAPDGIRDFYVGKRIIDRSRYKSLTEIVSECSEKNVSDSFFPSYRCRCDCDKCRLLI